MRDFPKLLLIRLIRLYQVVLSPWVGRQCRFIPTCSAYAMEAFEVHGAAKGLLLTMARLLRCHPLGGHGYDPVPEHFSWRCLFRLNPENKQAEKNVR